MSASAAPASVTTWSASSSAPGIAEALEVRVRVLADARVKEEIARDVATDRDPRRELHGRPRAKGGIAGERGQHRAHALVELERVHGALVFALRGEEAERDVHQVERGLDVELEPALACA